MVDAPPAGPTLVSVRRDLEQIDRAIVLLLAARVDAASTAIRLRSRLDGRIANPAQEARVLARAREWAKDLGLSPDLTDSIFRAILEAGKARFASTAHSPESTARSLTDRGHPVRASSHRIVPSVPRARVSAST